MSILIGFICLLLAGFLWTVPTQRKLPNRMLAVFLTLTAIELSGWLWVGPHNQYGWLNGFRQALGFLQMPVFFGFFVATCYSDFHLRWRDALHLIPFVLALLLILPGNQLPWGGTEALYAFSRAEQNFNWIASHVIYYVYTFAAIAVLWQFHKNFRAFYSGDRSEVLIWLSQLAVASLFAHTLLLVRDGLVFTPAHGAVLTLQIVGAFIALGITTWIALKSLLQPHLFRDVDRKLTAITARTKGHARSEFDQLLTFMENEKPYLDADLNLATLADQLVMTPREVSELINQSQGTHFFDFVNQYRINHAQSLLQKHPSQSVMEILHSSGFNSKSSFNTAFKKLTGLTPTQYRRKTPAIT